MKSNLKTSFGKCIYKFNEEIKIYENYLYRWLTFSSPYIQTLICKYKLHKPELEYMKPLTIAARYEKNNTCLLGLGGGGLVHFLNNLNIELTAIESNRQVIEVAQNYFMLNKLNNLELINMDANVFVQNKLKKFSHLLIDIHDSYNFPKPCLNIKFFENCKDMLKKNGVLAINICNNQDFDTIYNFLSSIFDKKILLIPVNGYSNIVLLASENYTINNIVKIYSYNQEIKKIEWDTNYGYICTYAY